MKMKIVCEKDRIIFEGKEALQYLKDLYQIACGEQAMESEKLEGFFYPKKEASQE